MEKKWWKNSVVYQIYPKSFCDSNGDGIGDLNGIINKLDYLNDLGVDVIWLCPIFKSPMIDNGYDISDYYSIDSQFGSNEDMELLIKEANKRGIKILMDLVVNHTSSEHEWFKRALEEPDSKYADYYIFREGIDGNPPNNWRSIFGGSTWEKVGETNKYYFHAFHKEQPDLNWENPELREELFKIVNYWLEKGLGGYRIDAITFIKKDQSFKSFPSDNIDGLVDCNLGCQNQEGINKFLKELKEKTFDKYNCITVAEAPGVPYSHLKDYISDDGYFSMIFDFNYSDLDVTAGEWYRTKDWSINELRILMFKSQLETQKVGWGALFLENHDQPRSLNKYIPEENIAYESATMLATMYFLLRGTPFIYQGQEIGMTNCKFDSIEEFHDISTHDQYQRALESGLSEEKSLECCNNRSRDNSRTPFQWNDKNNSGFTEGSPWLKLNSNYKAINAENQINDRHSIYSYYKQLIQLRKSSQYSDIIANGKFKPYLENYENIISYKRTLGDKTILIINNFSSENVDIKIADKIKTIILNNKKKFIEEKSKYSLSPYQSVVLEIEK